MKKVLIKEIKQDGNSKCIRFNRPEIKRYKLAVGKTIEIEIIDVYEDFQRS